MTDSDEPGEDTGAILEDVRRQLLLVEDDARVRRALRLALQDEGYAIDEAATAREGLARLDARQPDVVLLDVMLPDADGVAVCRDIRRRFDVPVIMVTARADSQDIVAGLEAGADDYVTKPFVASELSARVRALLRRAQPSTTNQVFQLGDLEINVGECRVTHGGTPLELTRTEFRLLCELAAADGRVCTREHLLERVWEYDYFGDSRVVDVHIRRLRTKVEAEPAEPRHVETVRGHGYRLTG